jgi:hypothetical protein
MRFVSACLPLRSRKASPSKPPKSQGAMDEGSCSGRALSRGEQGGPLRCSQIVQRQTFATSTGQAACEGLLGDGLGYEKATLSAVIGLEQDMLLLGWLLCRQCSAAGEYPVTAHPGTQRFVPTTAGREAYWRRGPRPKSPSPSRGLHCHFNHSGEYGCPGVLAIVTRSPSVCPGWLGRPRGTDAFW